MSDIFKIKKTNAQHSAFPSNSSGGRGTLLSRNRSPESAPKSLRERVIGIGKEEQSFCQHIFHVSSVCGNI
jgi:hypothetical protein